MRNVRVRIRIVLCVVTLAVLLLALVPGVAEAAPPAGYVWHQVSWGENLTGIAWRYGTTVWAIASTNGIYNVNRIYAGQWLKIPSYGGTYPPVSPGPTWYRVQPGDTLSGIAWRHGVNMYDLASSNGIWNINLIYVGQLIHIP